MTLFALASCVLYLNAAIVRRANAAMFKPIKVRFRTRDWAARPPDSDMKLNLIFLVAALFCLTAAAEAQTKKEPDYTIVKTAVGITIKYTRAAQPFSLKIAGKGATAVRDKDGAVSIQSDGDELVTVQFFETKDFIDLSKKLSSEEILRVHRDWRAWMLAAEMKGGVSFVKENEESLTITDSRAGAANQTPVVPALSWFFVREGERIFYRTALLENVVVMIGAAVKGGGETDRARAITKKALESLALLSAPPATKKLASSGKRKFLKRKNK